LLAKCTTAPASISQLTHPERKAVKGILTRNGKYFYGGGKRMVESTSAAPPFVPHIHAVVVR
jgi:hypothetical protein